MVEPSPLHQRYYDTIENGKVPEVTLPFPDPYALPRELGILRVLDSATDLTVKDVVGRVQGQKDRYVAKYAKKRVEEDKFYADKYGGGK